MRTFNVFLLMAISAIIIGCKAQQTICEKVTSPDQLPWLKQIVAEGEDFLGNKLLQIERVEYVIENTGVKGTGFVVDYAETSVIPDLMAVGVYDCDGQPLVSYGGYSGCQGECSLKILSRTTIFLAQ
ncbi:MAG: hypothetical protein J5823_02620 [Paludibacteraceae bacterium]|nr:hypothetical protein [Paludibacteraceae bacterium]